MIYYRAGTGEQSENFSRFFETSSSLFDLPQPTFVASIHSDIDDDLRHIPDIGGNIAQWKPRLSSPDVVLRVILKPQGVFLKSNEMLHMLPGVFW